MKDKTIDDPFYFQIQREINRIESKADTYTWMFYLIRITQIILTSAITFISGLADTICNSSAWTLFIGALVTAITAIDTLFQVEAKKNTYKLVLFELRTIRAEFVYKFIQLSKTNDSKLKEEILQKFREQLFEKYRNANSYARDLIGTDTEKEAKQNDNNVEAKNDIETNEHPDK
ncbi:SLATT domain-containing protein [Arcicella lustrica]|uniref:SLATT domain-containing protein n=1 Tax=Arcicella lustrica TaxID=2984196 RepID=A0ABU5SPJ8_9BACT|nr:SLATT domain-containing protein [Arcicella sp. DC25W]MEA5429236.1 SLATT domain-containing protein [Arcicella sp. DC25W]